MSSSISVVMTTYEGDSPHELEACFDSLHEQNRQPNEVLVVRDRNLPSRLVKIITEFQNRASFTVRDISITEKGRGHARKVGVQKAKSKFVAIIDADDIACSNRLQKQIEYFQSNPSADVVGGFAAEFETTPDNVQSIRKVPTESDEIRRMAYYRSPINHTTVMFRREAVLNVGNYRHLEYGEDYELWCRLLMDGKTLANIPEVLVKARATELIARRHGVEILRREIRLQRAIVRTGFYGKVVGFTNIAIRIPLRLLPKQSLKRLYHRFLRN